MTNQDKRVNLLIIIPLLVTVFVVGFGVTYAFFTKSLSSNKIISVASGTKYIGIYGEGKNNLQIGNTYTFTVENRGVEDSGYELYIETDATSTILASDVTCEVSTTSFLENKKVVRMDEKVLSVGSLGVGDHDRVTLNINSSQTGNYKGIIRLRYTDYVDDIEEDTSLANEPELVGDMIPVVYDEVKEIWKKVKPIAEKWYNYDQQRWANVVTIKDPSIREKYKKAIVGTSIQMEDINTFLVWIPRYSYTLGNSYGYQIEGASTPSKATPGAFDIKFVNKNITEMGSGQYTGSTPENYFTPSSFCWGDTCDDEATRKDTGNQELSGIWVSKFELTGTIDNISSIPSVTILRGQNVAGFFTGIKNGMNGENGLTNYGFSGNYDTHMIKNTEWGAFTYLSQSKYGKYGNPKYSGADKEVAINNCSKYITGIGGDSVSASSSSTTCNTNTYQTARGQAASTTGNIYGIYDASGGGWEYTMGNYTSIVSGSGFVLLDGLIGLDNSIPKKYYNLYTSSTGIKGDATNSDFTNGFYGNFASFPRQIDPWMARGGCWGNSTAAGIFAYYGNDGAGKDDYFSSHFSVISKKD